MSRADLVERLARHFVSSHGVELSGYGGQIVGNVDRLLSTGIRGGVEKVEDELEDELEQGDLVIQEMQ